MEVSGQFHAPSNAGEAPVLLLQLETATPAHSSQTLCNLREATAILYYEGVSKSFRTGRLERELKILQLSATRCSCIAIFCESV